MEDITLHNFGISRGNEVFAFSVSSLREFLKPPGQPFGPFEGMTRVDALKALRGALAEVVADLDTEIAREERQGASPHE